MNTWSDWTDISKINTVKSLYRWAGVYKIRISSQTGVPIQVCRFLGNDIEGILTIGNSNNVGRRINDFVSASDIKNSSDGHKKRPHSEGDLLFIIKMLTEFQKSLYIQSKIDFSSLKLACKAEAEKEEESLLKSYLVKFGELPPLNSNMPKRYKWDIQSTSKGLILNL